MLNTRTRDRRVAGNALGDELDERDELFERKVFDAVEIAHKRRQAFQSEVGLGEPLRHGRAPLRHGLAADRMNLGGAFAGEHVAVAIMLVLGANGIFPIVENLAP